MKKSFSFFTLTALSFVSLNLHAMEHIIISQDETTISLVDENTEQTQTAEREQEREDQMTAQEENNKQQEPLA